MSREFLFGKFYDIKDNKQREKIINKHSEYAKNKNVFLLDIYDNEGTLKTSYNSFNKNVIPVEEAKNKDLMYFTPNELKELMDSIASTSFSTKDRVYNVMNSYLDYCVSKGYITINNLSGLDKEELCRPPKLMARYRIVSKEDVYKWCDESVLTGRVSIMDCLPLLLARYGIVGKGLSRIINLKLENINTDNKTIEIYEEDKLLVFPVDDRLIEYIYRAVDLKEHNNLKYIDSGNIIKAREDYPNLIVDEAYIYNKVTAIFNLKIMPRISFKALELSRKIDFLLDIREERMLDTEDFKQITLMFNPNPSVASHISLVKNYESITGDEVNPPRGKNRKKDNHSKKTAEKIREQLGL